MAGHPTYHVNVIKFNKYYEITEDSNVESRRSGITNTKHTVGVAI